MAFSSSSVDKDPQKKELFVSLSSRTNPLRLSYVEWGNETSPHLILCIHGFSRNGRDFDFLARALASQGYRVICPDMPGRGQSDWLPSHEEYTPEIMQQALWALINHLSPSRYTWIGTSMGGLMGLGYAASPALSAQLSGLILNDVGPFIEATPLKTIKSYLEIQPTFPSQERARSFLKQWMAPFGIQEESHWDHLASHSFFVNSEGHYQLAYDPKILKSFSVHPIDLWSLWETVQCPVLVIRGEFSNILTQETMGRMGEKSHVTCHVIKGAGHAPSLMDPDHIHIITRWLERH